MATHPTHIGRYRLDGVLGQGGSGLVYAATLEGPGGFEKRVALKVLRRKAEESPSGREALFREARLGAMLRHPNLIDIYELGESDGHVFIAMELVDGPSVVDLLRHRLLPPKAAIEVARQACAGLAHAHELVVRGESRPVVHRDIKPSNILVDHTGLVKIADLGIASMAGDSQPIEGTKGFMSPEQCAGYPLDARSDIFNVGILLWTMVLGSSPLHADTLKETFLRTLDVEKILADPEQTAHLEELAPGLPEVIRGCMRLRPDHRYPSARAVARELRGLLRQARGDSLLDVVSEEDTSDPDSGVWVTLPAPDTVSLGRDAPLALQPIRQPDTPFVGRASSSQSLAALVGDPSAPVVTVHGPPGVGKSRLLQHTLAAMTGVTYADLAGLETEHDLHEALAGCLAIQVAGQEADALQASIRASLHHREGLLVVLDNVDGVREPLKALTDGLGHGARLVISCREPLDVAGERTLRLKPMRPADARRLFESVAGGLPSDDKELASLESLLDQLGGRPLAIELAASRARSIPIRLIVDAVARQLQDRAPGERPSAVSGTVEWSWEQLDAAEQAALAQLSVFEGSFSVDAAHAVIDTSELSDAPWALDLLTGLAQHALVQTISSGEEPRYRLYPAVRTFATARLADPAATWLHYVQWFARMGAPSARERLFGADGPAYLARVALTLPDLVRACKWAAVHGKPELAGATFLAAIDIIRVQGPMSLGFELAEIVVPLRGLGPLRADVLLAVGDLHSQAGATQAAAQSYKRALGIARRTDDPVREGHVLSQLAVVEQQVGQEEEALRDALKAAELLDGRDLRLHGVALANLGLIHRLHGQLDLARSALRRAMATLETAGDAADTAIALGTLANVLRDEGSYGESEKMLRQSLGLHRRVGNRRSECVSLGNLGALLLRLERYPEAETALRTALELAEELGYTNAEAILLGRLGDTLRRLERFEEASAALQRSRQLLGELGDTLGAVESLVALASLHRDRGQHEEARAAYLEAWEHLEESGPIHQQVVVAIGLARLPRKGRRDRELQRLMKVRRAVEQRGDPVDTGALLVEEATLLSGQGNRRTASATLSMALSLLADVEISRELRQRVAELRSRLGR